MGLPGMGEASGLGSAVSCVSASAWSCDVS
jgi:hypothetical protein